MLWAMYAVMVSGILLHVLKRITPTSGRFAEFYAYCKLNGLRLFASWLTGTVLFVGWTFQPDLAAALGFAYEPGVLSAAMLGFVADSLFAIMSDRVEAKAKNG